MRAACLLTTGCFRWGIYVHLDPLTVSRAKPPAAAVL